MAAMRKGAIECALVEAVGTFLFALAIFQTRESLAIGLILMAALYLGTHGHVPYLNSAVSFGEFFGKKIDLNAFLMSVLGQIVGVFGAAALAVRLGNAVALPGAAAIEVLATTEVITSFVFVMVVMRALAQKSDLYGLVIGLTATGLIMMGGLFNPSIALGVMLYNAVMLGMGVAPTMYIVGYVVVPLVGAVLAVLFNNYMQGMKR